MSHQKPGAVEFSAIEFGSNDIVPRRPGRVSEMGDVLKGRLPIAGLRIDGHADERGTALYNLRLSWRRACYVAERLRRKLGRAAPPMQVRAFGEARPVAPNIHPNGSVDARGQARNRRVEVTILAHEPRPGLQCPPRSAR